MIKSSWDISSLFSVNHHCVVIKSFLYFVQTSNYKRGSSISFTSHETWGRPKLSSCGSKGDLSQKIILWSSGLKTSTWRVFGWRDTYRSFKEAPSLRHVWMLMTLSYPGVVTVAVQPHDLKCEAEDDLQLQQPHLSKHLMVREWMTTASLLLLTKTKKQLLPSPILWPFECGVFVFYVVCGDVYINLYITYIYGQ